MFGSDTDLGLTDVERAALETEINQQYYPTEEFSDILAEPLDLPPPVDPADIIVNEEGLEVIQGEILVGWDETMTVDQRAQVVTTAGGTIRYDDPETRTSIVYVADQTTVPQVAAALAATTGVSGAMQNYLLETDAATGPPTDPDYTDTTKSWWLRRINMEPAWRMTTGSSTVVVAVIDAGFELDHPDLAGAFTNTTLNFTTTALDATPRHGTHVSGIIAARQNNNTGLTGIAPGVRVLPIKINDLGRLPQVFRTLRQWPGMRIASMSMGWGWGKKNRKRVAAGKPALTVAQMQQHADTYDAIIRPSFEQYYQRGGIFCKSAGNDYGYDSKLNGLNFAEVITVAAGDATGNLTNFSNVGDQVDITGPGYKIWSPVNGHSYAYLSGTSMATPAVCASAALVRSLRPAYGALLVKKILEKGAVEPNNYLDTWRTLLRATRRFGVTGSVVNEDLAFVANAEVSTQPSAWNVSTTADGDYVIPFLVRQNSILIARRGETKGQESVAPPPLSGDEVVELVLIELQGKDDSNANADNNGNVNSNANENTNDATNTTDDGSNDADGTAGTDNVGEEQVLDNGVIVSAEGCAVSGFTVPPAEGDCAPGYYFSRETIACEQIECPAGVGRTYTLECKCEGEDRQAIYACDQPGYMVACLQN
jgi:subtilisin family serine protease